MPLDTEPSEAADRDGAAELTRTASGRIVVAETAAPIQLGEFVVGSPLELTVLGRSFRGTREADGLRVVLRLIERGDEAARERVKKTLAVLQEIHHPALARVVAHGHDGDRDWYALEAPECVTLVDFVRRGRPLDGAEVAWVGSALSSALAALHARSLPHGDVNPMNVGITAEGKVLLVDLGWAPRLRDASWGEPVDDAAALDLNQVAATLLYATTGQAVKARSGRYPRAGLATQSTAVAKMKPVLEQATWLTPAIAKIIDDLFLDTEVRLKASEVEIRFRAAAAELGGNPDAPPPDLVDTARQLADVQPRAGADKTVGPAQSAGAKAPQLGAFGRYLLLEEVARGGMGVVYRARHAELDRVFALKVLLSGELANDLARRRFLREAEAAAQLDHPSIVRVHDFGEHEGRAYLAMDFADGRSLGQIVAEKGLGERDWLELIAKVCDAVHYAHSRGIIHRDLKPQNVIVDKQLVPHILDFGVAKRLDEESARPGQAGAGLTTEGELVGTPAYMPPEQAEGRAKDIDTRSDVYSLGVMLFEIATGGRLPFEGLTVTDVLTKVLLDDAPPPSRHVPGLPWEVDAIVLKAIEKDPRRRYQSAAELAGDVRRFLDGLPIQARRATALYRAKKWAVRNRRVLPFAGIAVLAIAAIPYVLLREARLAKAQKQAEVRDYVEKGDAALAARDPEKWKDAQKAFAAALFIDPANEHAIRGSATVEVLLRRLKEEREAVRRQADLENFKKNESRSHAQKGRELLAKNEIERAQEAFLKALAFDNASDEARRGLSEANRIEFGKKAEQEARERRERDEREARRLVNEGHAALAAHDAKAASAAFFQALGFDPQNAEAKNGLHDAERLAYADEEARRREKNVAEAKAQVAKAQERLVAKDYAQARAAFTVALGFDGSNADAVRGISELDRAEREIALELEQKKKKEEADGLLAKGRESLAKGQQLVKEGADHAAIRTAYYEAIEAFDRAAFLVPGEASYAKDKTVAARELATFARSHQDYGLAEWLGRVIGERIDAAAEQAPEVDTNDSLVVRESDAIMVQRAFREPLSFEEKESSDFLAPVRALVEPKRDRFRLNVDVRSRVAPGPNPVVYVTGVTLRLEDLKRGVQFPAERIDFDGGGYQRIVVVGTKGRVVPSLKKSLANNAEEVLGRIKASTTKLIETAEKK